MSRTAALFLVYLNLWFMLECVVMDAIQYQSLAFGSKLVPPSKRTIICVQNVLLIEVAH